MVTMRRCSVKGGVQPQVGEPAAAASWTDGSKGHATGRADFCSIKVKKAARLILGYLQAELMATVLPCGLIPRFILLSKGFAHTRVFSLPAWSVPERDPQCAERRARSFNRKAQRTPTTALKPALTRHSSNNSARDLRPSGEPAGEPSSPVGSGVIRGPASGGLAGLAGSDLPGSRSRRRAVARSPCRPIRRAPAGPPVQECSPASPSSR